MDIAESTKIVFSRIKELEPENALKIVAQILMQHTEADIVEYARGSDQMIQLLIREAKNSLLSPPKFNAPAPLLPAGNRVPSFMASPIISRRLSHPSTFRVPAPYLVPHHVSDEPPPLRSLDIPPSSYNETVNQADFTSLEGQLHSPNHLGQLQSPNHLGQLQSPNHLGREFSGNFHHPNAAVGGGLVARTDMRSPLRAIEFPCRTSPYFCNHDMNCNYPHGQGVPDSLSPMQNLSMNELINDDYVFALESLQKLEMEIVELLRARKGAPVSIASLPMIYHEMYGKALQADGYVTESQRHVRTGYNLTKLLARLSHICLLDRPHGQHSVVLAEDAPKYMEYRNERSDSGAVPGSSHQIYLTFPAESTFTKDDVSDYFSKYGPVCDVRIPRQEKRMFGFVSFLHAETVTRILMEGHPHYICGARVLVKPYKEKSTMNDRKYMEKIENPISYSPYTEMDPSPHSFPGAFGGPTLLEKQLIQNHEQALELERRRLLELHLSQKSLIRHPFFGNMTAELRSTEDQLSSVPDQMNFPTTDEHVRNTSTHSNDQDSEHIELPESPFTYQ